MGTGRGGSLKNNKRTGGTLKPSTPLKLSSSDMRAQKSTGDTPEFAEIDIPDTLTSVVNAVDAAGGKALLVGGAVRDFVATGAKPKDFDVEIHGLDADHVQKILEKHGSVDEVGKSFGVLKMTDEEGNDFDFSLPRRDSKQGEGHKGFSVEVDPTMNLEEAASRRDFSLNSMMMNLKTGELFDPHGGQQDLQDGTLKHTSEKFAEDPLRVLRAMQFAGRFGLKLDPKTAELAKSLKGEFKTLPKERVWGEWEKWAEKSKDPAAGIQALLDADWADLFPHLAEISGVERNPKWHPEGDVMAHTKHTLTAAAEIADREKLEPRDRAILMLAILTHDFGKIPTTHTKADGNISSEGHPEHSEAMAMDFLNAINAPKSLKKPGEEAKPLKRAVMALAREHMAHVKKEINPAFVRNLAARLGNDTNIEMLSHVMEADAGGRPPLPKKHPAPKMLEIARQEGVDKAPPKPLLTGKMLAAMGVKSGSEMGRILREVYQKQLDAEINTPEEAQSLVKQFIG